MNPRNTEYWETDFGRKTREWHKRLIEESESRGFDTKLNSVEKLVRLAFRCRDSNIVDCLSQTDEEEKTNADKEQQAVKGLAFYHTCPPASCDPSQFPKLLKAELFVYGRWLQRSRTEKAKTRGPVSAYEIFKDCSQWLNKATLDEFARTPGAPSLPLLGIYTPGNDDVWRPWHPMILHLHAFKTHCSEFLRLTDETEAKERAHQQFGEFDLDREQRDMFKVMLQETMKIMKEPHTKISPKTQATVTRIFIAEIPEIISRNAPEDAVSAVAEFVRAWIDTELRQTEHDYEEAMSEQNWALVENYLTAVAGQYFVQRLKRRAEGLMSPEDLATLWQQADARWNPSKDKFAATMKLSGVSSLCNYNADLLTIRHQLRWLLGTEDDRASQASSLEINRVYTRLVSVIERLVFDEIGPRANARKDVETRLSEKIESISKNVPLRMTMLTDKIIARQRTLQTELLQHRFAVELAKERCFSELDVFGSSAVGSESCPASLVNELTVIFNLSSSNLGPMDPELYALLQDRIPSTMKTGIGHFLPSGPLDWSAATFRVFDLNQWPFSNPAAPLTARNVAEICVAQSLKKKGQQ